MKRITTIEAGLIMDKSPQFIRVAMQQDKLPIGTVIKSKGKYAYYISPKLLADFTGADVNTELEKIRGGQNES